MNDFFAARRGLLVASFLTVVIPALAAAQENADSLRRELRLPQPATYAIAARGEWVAPGLAIGVPSGYGAGYGDAFVGVAFQARTRWRDAPDGGVGVGFGLGDADRFVGLELAFTSFGTVRTCCRGGFSPKVHRALTSDVSVAIGWENLVTWGERGEIGDPSATDAGRSLYAAATKILVMRDDPGSFLGTAALTAGVGNGRFRRESDILAGRERVNPFFSAGVGLHEQASVIASWTGQDLMAGISVVPFRGVPLFITPGVADLTTSPRAIVGIGFGFNYASLF